MTGMTGDYSPENIIRTIKNVDFYRNQLISVRERITSDIEQLRERCNEVMMLSSAPLTPDGIRTSDISDTTCTKTIQLERLKNDLEEYEKMLDTNLRKETEINRIYGCFYKTAELFPLHYYVGKAAWVNDELYAYIAKDIKKTKTAIAPMLRSLARVIGIMAEKEAAAPGSLNALEWNCYIKSEKPRLFSDINKYEI